ncbi:hypothetical protein Tco_0070507, partial [Tanacetum coccineum]
EEGHGLDDKGQGLDDEGQGLDDEGQGLEDVGPSREEEEEAAPEEHEGAERVSAFRQPTLVTWVDLVDGKVYTDIPTYVPLDEPVQTPPSPEWSLCSFLVSPSSPLVPSPIASLVATLTTTLSVDEDQFLEFRSLEREQERATVTFSAIWRLNHDLRMQIAEERHERLELADRVSRMERRHESKEE